jgi:tetratricopeptide (TPR) repeat protein
MPVKSAKGVQEAMKDFLGRLREAREEKRREASELVDHACGLSEAGKAAEALKVYDSAVEADPGLASARRARGAARGRAGDFRGALEDLSAAVRIEPRCAPAWNDLGLTCEILGDAEGALGCFMEAVRRNPDHVPAWKNIGRLYGMMDQPEKALEHLRKAAELKPDDFEAHLGCALALRDLKMDREGLEAVGEALALHPLDARALTLKAELVAARHDEDKRGDFTEALELVDKAIEADPSYASAWAVKGSVFKLMGWDNEAEEFFSRARRLAGFPEPGAAEREAYRDGMWA